MLTVTPRFALATCDGQHVAGTLRNQQAYKTLHCMVSRMRSLLGTMYAKVCKIMQNVAIRGSEMQRPSATCKP